VTVTLGLQIPNFSYGSGISELFPSVIAQAREAEAAGFDSVFLMDHLYQLPGPGVGPDDPMLEAYTALGALATATRRVQLGALVTGNTYRNPALLAKIISTLDVVSAGRAILGLGAGWFQLEHDQLGFEFGTFTDRFNRLKEALQIIDPMLKGEQPTFKGTWYQAESARNNPRFRASVPIMLGGSGEKKTFAIAARYADHLNMAPGFNNLSRKLKVLAQRCEEIERDPATLKTSTLIPMVIDVKMTSDQIPDGMQERMLVGSAESVAEQVKTKVIDAGVDGVIVNLSSHGYTPGLITKVGEALRPVLVG
jgi:F420-dependent oxidoreductase-like protein